MKHLFASESVSEGHPDKLADKVSDAILDAYLAADSSSKVACETLVTPGGIYLSGEVHSAAELSGDIDRIVRKAVHAAGYDDPALGFDDRDIFVRSHLHEQSLEIRKGVDEGGAGDQGLMFGYACSETPELMPLAIQLAHRIMEQHSRLRSKGRFHWLLPDAKSQVVIVYENGNPVGISSVVVSTWHQPGLSPKKIEGEVIEHMIKPVIPPGLLKDDIRYMINPSGSFLIGGPTADTGLTGRKIIVDTYGGSCSHGGGAFSGKDPSKVDRSGAYAARYIAKNLVASGLCSRATVQLAYAIGLAEPCSVYVDTHGTCNLATDEEISRAVRDIFPIRPLDIISFLNLRSPVYSETSAFGHMGRENRQVVKHFRLGEEEKTIEAELFTWEKTNKTEELRNYFRV